MVSPEFQSFSIKADKLLYAQYMNAGNEVILQWCCRVLMFISQFCFSGYGAAAGVLGGNGAKPNGEQSLNWNYSLLRLRTLKLILRSDCTALCVDWLNSSFINKKKWMLTMFFFLHEWWKVFIKTNFKRPQHTTVLIYPHVPCVFSMLVKFVWTVSIHVTIDGRQQSGICCL